MFTDYQIERAKKARELYQHAIGTPSTKDFKAIVMINAIKNLPVTIDDVNMAEKIFGPDVGALKVKKRVQGLLYLTTLNFQQLLLTIIRKLLCVWIQINSLYFFTTILCNSMYCTME
jgi:hypothetical protein